MRATAIVGAVRVFGEELERRQRYRPSRSVEPPPDAALIDTYTSMPLAPEIRECETCAQLAACRQQCHQLHTFARAECNGANGSVPQYQTPYHGYNMANVLILTALRRDGPQTINQLVKSTNLLYHTIDKALRRIPLRDMTRVIGKAPPTVNAAGTRRSDGRVYALKEYQPCDAT
jgi:hypothetical protein